jgi:hypothetical protein
MLDADVSEARVGTTNSPVLVSVGVGGGTGVLEPDSALRVGFVDSLEVGMVGSLTVWVVGSSGVEVASSLIEAGLLTVEVAGSLAVEVVGSFAVVLGDGCDGR